jgi:hypothetical protein
MEEEGEPPSPSMNKFKKYLDENVGESIPCNNKINPKTKLQKARQRLQ